LIQPILYLAFFGPLLTKIAAGGLPGFPPGNSYSFFVPGLLVQLGLFGAAFVGFTIISDWRAGVIERFRVTAVSLSAISYAVGLALKSEDALAPLINMIVVPLMLLSGIMLPLTLGPGWL